jgi:hypothetical protein
MKESVSVGTLLIGEERTFSLSNQTSLERISAVLIYENLLKPAKNITLLNAMFSQR